MTEEQRKEALSKGFVRLVTAMKAIKCDAQELDHGVDLRISRAQAIEINGETKVIETGEMLDVQLKSTTAAGIVDDESEIKYDLAADTYNSLILRRQATERVPLFLILFVLDQDPVLWLSQREEEWAIGAKAFWYRPDIGEAITVNVATKRIVIPKDNLVDLEFFPRTLEETYA